MVNKANAANLACQAKNGTIYHRGTAPVDFTFGADFDEWLKQMTNPKRQLVGLSLSPEEKCALDAAAKKDGLKPTSFATILYRFAFRQLLLGMSVQEMIEMAQPPPTGNPPSKPHKKGTGD